MDIQNIKDKRTRGAAAYAKFCQEKRQYQNQLFCFFEGEDAKYYIPRIEIYSGYSFDKISHYNCGGKAEVLKALHLVEKNNDKVHFATAFFIDKDYDTAKSSNSLLYQTPCYSIENLYTSGNAFSKMLNREFGMNPTDEDFSKCCDEYSKRQQEFHEKTVYLNSWLACQRLQEKTAEIHKICLSDFKILKLFTEISIERVICKEDINRERVETLFPDFMDVDECEIERKMEYFKNGDMALLFRGKFEMEFFKKIVESLTERNRSGNYFSKKYTSVQINPYINTLSALESYADTPQNLIDFLSQYRKSL